MNPSEGHEIGAPIDLADERSGELKHDVNGSILHHLRWVGIESGDVSDVGEPFGAQEPERVARLLLDRGVVKHYDYAVQTIKELPYARWRDYDSTDTLRFYALRLHEAGLVKSSPQKIIAQGSDLRFVDELKKELKG